MFSRPLRLLFLSTPVGPLGSGIGGGVELTLQNLAQILMQRGHSVQVLAPAGSQAGNTPIVPISGTWQPSAQNQGRDTPVSFPADAVLPRMWEEAWRRQGEFDLLLNFAYDWLPFYLTPFFERAIAHFVSMGSLSDAMDQIVAQVAQNFPGTIGVYSRAQAETFAFADRCQVLGSGLDLSLYDFCPEPENYLGWVGRIAPEKGLEDAIAAAEQTRIPLKIWGALQDQDYWQRLQHRFPDAPIAYQGFLPTVELQRGLRRCRGFLMTPRWVEAFGNVTIEALACGVPVIAYQRGGPAEIVRHGQTGWLVEPDSVSGLVEAIAQLPRINRWNCRQQAEQEYSLNAMGDRVEKWLDACLTMRR